VALDGWLSLLRVARDLRFRVLPPVESWTRLSAYRHTDRVPDRHPVGWRLVFQLRIHVVLGGGYGRLVVGRRERSLSRTWLLLDHARSLCVYVLQRDRCLWSACVEIDCRDRWRRTHDRYLAIEARSVIRPMRSVGACRAVENDELKLSCDRLRLLDDSYTLIDLDERFGESINLPLHLVEKRRNIRWVAPHLCTQASNLCLQA